MFMSRSSKLTFHRYLISGRKVLVDKRLLSGSIVAGLYCNHQYCDDKFPLPPKKHLLAIARSQKVQSNGSNERNIHRALRWLKKKLDILVSLIFRSIYLMLAFGPVLLTSGLLLSDSDDIKGWWWAFFRDSIRKSGPCSTKFAQWIATRPDLFPMLLCKNLEDLQSKALCHSWRETEDALFLAFGGKWKESLHIEGEGIRGSNSFSPVVLGSGCVAQVLLGKLEGRQVAVKIIHPGVKASIEADVAILRFISWLVELIPGTESSFSLSDCVEEFSSLMMLQLDMKLEAENLERFRRNFHLSDDSSASNQIPSITSFFAALSSSDVIRPFKGKVTFPHPVRPYVSDSVLVETFESGRQISGILDKMVNKKLRREIATAGLDAILQMVFKDNFIHADLHPGNVLFREFDPGNVSSSSSSSLPSSLLSPESAQGSPNQWELSFIDAGLVSTLDKEDRRNFIDLFSAVVQNDGKRVGELMVDRSRGGGAKCINREKFVAEIGDLVTSVHSSGLSLGRIGIGALLQKVLVLCYVHQVKLEPKFVSVMIAMGVVEGLGKRLDPDVDVLLRAAPHVLKAALFV